MPPFDFESYALRQLANQEPADPSKGLTAYACVAQSKVSIEGTRQALVHLEQEGLAHRVPGDLDAYRITPEGRARLRSAKRGTV